MNKKKTVVYGMAALLFAALVAAVWHLFGGAGAGMVMATGALSTESAFDEVKGLMLKSIGKINGYVEDVDKVSKQVDTIRGHVDTLRRSGARGPAGSVKGPNDVVSQECARAIASIFILEADAIGGLKSMDNQRRESLVAASRESLGLTQRAALTSSDVPLPIGYGDEVIELVSQFGFARKFGTVFPLGAGQVKLPRLGTDPTFGLIAASGTVSEKSPTVVFVTFNAEKFGGLVRVPSEIDADSIVSIGQFLARYCARNIAYVEDYNFFASTGAGSGINGSVAGLTSSTITNSKVVQMASTKTKYSDATLTNIRAIRATVDAPILRTGAYYMHPSFEQHLSGLNTAGDKPYNPQAQIMGVGASGFANIGPTLDGFPIRWVDVLPAYSTSANVSKVFMLFGDATYQYLGVRPGLGMEISREVFFATDELAFRCLERFTIGLMAAGAVSGLQTAAS